MSIQVPITDPENPNVIVGKLTTTYNVGEWIADQLSRKVPIGLTGEWTFDNEQRPELHAVSLQVGTQLLPPEKPVITFEIPNEMLRVIEDLHRRKCDEMKREMEWENEPAWTAYVNGIAEAYSLAKQVVDSSSGQPVESKSTG